MRAPEPPGLALRAAASASTVDTSTITEADPPSGAARVRDGSNPEPLAASPRPPPPASTSTDARIADMEREVRELRAKLASVPAPLPRQQQQQQQPRRVARPPAPALPPLGTPSPCPQPLLVVRGDIPQKFVLMARFYCHLAYALSLGVAALLLAAMTADSPWARCASKRKWGEDCREPYIPCTITLAFVLHESIVITCVVLYRCWRRMTSSSSSSSSSSSGSGSGSGSGSSGGGSSGNDEEPLPSYWDAVPLLQAAPTPYTGWVTEGTPVRRVLHALLFREWPRFTIAPLLVLIFSTLSAAVEAPYYGSAPSLPGHAALVACPVLASAWLLLSAAWPKVMRAAWERAVGCSCSGTQLVEEPMAVPRSAAELSDLGEELKGIMSGYTWDNVRFRYLGGDGAVHGVGREDFLAWARLGLLTGGGASPLPPIEFQRAGDSGGWALMPHAGIVHWGQGAAEGAGGGNAV